MRWRIRRIANGCAAQQLVARQDVIAPRSRPRCRGRLGVAGPAIRGAQPAAAKILDTDEPRMPTPPASRRRGKTGQYRPSTLPGWTSVTCPSTEAKLSCVSGCAVTANRRAVCCCRRWHESAVPAATSWFSYRSDSAMTSGCRNAIWMSACAAPDGWRRPCSHS